MKTQTSAPLGDASFPGHSRRSVAGFLALALPLGLLIPTFASGSEQTLVVVSGRQVVDDGDQVCFRLHGNRNSNDRLSVHVRFAGTVPRGALAVDGYPGPSFRETSQPTTFNASVGDVHRLTIDLRQSATMELLSLTAADSDIERVTCSTYEGDMNHHVLLDPMWEDDVDLFERPSGTASGNDDSPYYRDDRTTPAMTVPAGTEIELTLDETVSTQTHRAGEQVSAHLDEAVLVDGWTALPAGTRVVGSVTESRKAGRFGRSRLRLGFDHAILSDGTSVPISAGLQRLGKGSAGKQGGIIAGSAVGGAIAGKALGTDPILGAVVGGGIAAGVIAAKPGKPVVLPAGTVLVMALDDSAELPRRNN